MCVLDAARTAGGQHISGAQGQTRAVGEKSYIERIINDVFRILHRHSAVELNFTELLRIYDFLHQRRSLVRTYCDSSASPQIGAVAVSPRPPRSDASFSSVSRSVALRALDRHVIGGATQDDADLTFLGDAGLTTGRRIDSSLAMTIVEQLEVHVEDSTACRRACAPRCRRAGACLAAHRPAAIPPVGVVAPPVISAACARSISPRTFGVVVG